ncbi:MAG: bifunctional phosphoglucose/phosphomannose isomerase, partial [Nitrospinae bacterium]|nr:bifunctional phosphoglucose/phosphomannose isomerase [Nitrospinota bacterium]
MIDLNDHEIIRKIDASCMIDHLIGFPQQCSEAVELGKGFENPWSNNRLQKIVIAGMGGSAIGGDILRSYLSDKIDLPIYVNRNYTLPMFVDKDTLLFVVSYSGNTEETITS